MSDRTPSTDIAETLEIDAPAADVWVLLSDTSRYAEWVESCLEVTYDHGAAALHGVYREVGHGLGPLTVATTWTVAEIKVGDGRWYRRDTGTGMPLVGDLESIFELADDSGKTGFTWHNRYTPAFGAVGRRIDRLQQTQLRAMMRRSMQTLQQLVAAGPGTPSA